MYVAPDLPAIILNKRLSPRFVVGVRESLLTTRHLKGAVDSEKIPAP